jgi:hypothetical protein
MLSRRPADGVFRKVYGRLLVAAHDMLTLDFWEFDLIEAQRGYMHFTVDWGFRGQDRRGPGGSLSFARHLPRRRSW